MSAIGQPMPNALSGAMQGYEFIDRIEARKEQGRQNSALFDAKMGEYQDKKTISLGKSIAHSIDNNVPINPEHMREFMESSKIDLGTMFEDDTYMDKLNLIREAIKNGNNPNTPEMLDAINTVFKGNIQRGIGDEGPDGTPIADKKVVQVAPGRKGSGSLVMNLENTTEGGQKYKAGVSENRGTSDEFLKNIPMKDLVKHVQGQYLFLNAVTKGGFKEQIKSAVIAAGGSWVDPNKKLNDAKALETHKANLKAKDPTGKNKDDLAKQKELRQTLTKGTSQIEKYFSKYNSMTDKYFVPDEVKDDVARLVSEYQIIQSKSPSKPYGIVVLEALEKYKDLPGMDEIREQAKADLKGDDWTDPDREDVEKEAGIRLEKSRENLGKRSDKQSAIDTSNKPKADKSPFSQEQNQIIGFAKQKLSKNPKARDQVIKIMKEKGFTDQQIKQAGI